jgi:hypothetical protein
MISGYSNAVGKWALNASNAADFVILMKCLIRFKPYLNTKRSPKMSLHMKVLSKNRFIQSSKVSRRLHKGDGPLWYPNMPKETMFSVYGSGHVGFFGGIIQATNVPEILQINCTEGRFFCQSKKF